MDTKKAAIGSIHLLVSRVIILACGFVIHIFLARQLGPTLYGLYGLIMSILLWVECTVMLGIPSTYSKVISEDEKMINSVLYSIKKLFTPYCLTIFAVFCLVSPLVSRAFNDSRLLLLLLIAGIDIPFYGLYYAYLGILNGKRAFMQQALALTGYILFKLTFIVIFVLLNFGIVGVLIGNTLASFLGLLVALFFIKGLKSQVNKSKIFNLKPRIVTFGLPYLLYMMATMLFINIDMWLVKGLLNNDAMVGFYSASSNLSRPVFFLMAGIITAIFPSFSKAASEGNAQLLQRYIQQAMRLALVILLPLVVMIGTTADEFISLLFSPAYLPASNSLKLLLVGMLSFSIFSLYLNVIAAKNKPFCSLSISLLLLPAAVILHYLLIRGYGIVGAAMTTTMISAIGLLISGAYLWSRFGALINFSTLWKVALAVGCLFLVSKSIAVCGYWLLPKYLLLFVIYLGLLLLLREINRGDIKIIKETCCSLFRPAQCQEGSV